MTNIRSGSRILLWLSAGIILLALQSQSRAEFRAGAAVVDVSPVKLPVLINGNMLPKSVSEIKTPVNARALCLDDGKITLAIVVVDTCMMPRTLLDEVKAEASQKTGIPASRLLISATHAHSAPSCMGCLGVNADETYVPHLKTKLVEAVAASQAALEPAQFGWTVAQAPDFTALRRWVRRSDRVNLDPFGNPTVRANMHPGFLSEDATGPSGPEDPDLTLLAFRGIDDRPLAVLANFSMHYFGDKAISADYFGLFCEGLKRRLVPEAAPGKSPFVGIMSHGCSGDIYLRDYAKPAPPKENPQTIESYTDGMLAIALKALGDITYRSDITLAMEETKLPLRYRLPDKQRLEWAHRLVDSLPDGQPTNTEQIYAREAILLNEKQQTELILQALRIGDFGIATTPNETYALTGLKIKSVSPLAGTMVIELANGAEGYIPPPEQHALGGYNTWPARTAGLEESAEPRIAETDIQLLEKVAEKPRKDFRFTAGPLARRVLDLKPAAYWRLDETAGPRAGDVIGSHDAIYEPGVLFYLEGPDSAHFSVPGETNRAAHFAGGRVLATLPNLPSDYTISLWLWNGMPNEARGIAGWCFSRDRSHVVSDAGDHLGIAGTAGRKGPGRLVFQHGRSGVLHEGRSEIPRWSWIQVVMVRQGEDVSVYLNGSEEPEISAKEMADFPPGLDQIMIGGRADGTDGWEGRLDEISIFPRALNKAEIGEISIH
ncbi:MAG: LamG domain-containing protein [Verrucomicrobiales bacterium]|nr:LamG domain-containing protein [Akkermansiaceae bacterium]